MRREWEEEAYGRGKRAALAAAGWVTDGNESDESRRRKLAMMDEGDPAVWDVLPTAPNLSGEFADAPTPQSLACEIVGCGTGADGDDVLLDALADAFERGVGDHFEEACEAELRKWVEA